MLSRHELLRKHDALHVIDHRVRQLLEQRRGWIAADPLTGTMTIVHVRPYLAVQGLPPTMRIETADLPAAGELATLVRGSAYAVVFLRGSRNLVPEHAPYMQELQACGIPWLAVWKERKIFWSADAEGSVTRLHDGVAPRIAALELSGNGEEGTTLAAQVPFHLRIRADNDKAFFSLAVRNPAGFFDEEPVHYSCSTADGTAIATSAQVDVALRVDRPDALVLHSDSRFQLRPAPSTPVVQRDAARPVVLHIVYDRTMLDAASWQDAVTLADGVALQGEKEVGGQQRPDTRSWNRLTRVALADALTKLTAAHPAATIDLWWFADIERGAIAAVQGLEVPPSPIGRIGECIPERLSDTLGGPAFHYASGLDIFDAVDEALLDLSARIPSSDEKRHVVVVAGDSPPPPEGPADVIWERILTAEFASNGRTSLDFRKALAALKAKKVPVGWLFVNPTDAPDLPNVAGLGSAFVTMQSIRQRALEALHGVDGLTVVSCPTLGELEARLGALFDRLRDRHAPALARLSLRESA